MVSSEKKVGKIAFSEGIVFSRNDLESEEIMKRKIEVPEDKFEEIVINGGRFRKA